MALIFDIETIGEKFDKMDEETQEALTWWIRQNSSSEKEYQERLQKEIKDLLGLWPFTGEIVSIGVLDGEKERGTVYFQAPGEEIDEFAKEAVTYKQKTEEEMLTAFWEGVKQYDEFVGFNSRPFDVPYMMIRSAIHGIRPSINLMSNRYLGSQRGPAHIDLLDQLTFYGAQRKKGNLHLWARAFGIETPKGGDIKGDEVGEAFRDGKFKEIARYNARDLWATLELYKKWDTYLRF